MVGFGAIGRAVAARARALDIEVVAHDPALANDDPQWSTSSAQPMALPALLASSDAVSLHVPLLESTRHLLDASAIATMKPGAVLINTARGGVLDEDALAAALAAGALGGALLDVFEHEPLAAGSRLPGVPNLYLTPHIAGLTLESQQRVGTLIAARVGAALAE